MTRCGWASGARYGATFGSHHGRDAIIAMLDSYRSPPHFTFNAHFLTSETITVTANMGAGPMDDATDVDLFERSDPTCAAPN
jgi:hypothetical protein